MGVNKPKLLIKTHLGMGDHIVHNGLIRKITQDNPEYQIYTCTKSINYKNVVYMYRDNPQITVLDVYNDSGLHNISKSNFFDKIISTHFADGKKYDYETYFDDTFYMMTNLDPKVKTEYFYIQRDYVQENNVYNELVVKKGISDYIFVHEKSDYNIKIDRNKLEKDVPIIIADVKYGIFELLKVIEKAKSVNVISSSFLSLFTCYKYNKNIFAHMYCDRSFISPYIKKHDIKIL